MFTGLGIAMMVVMMGGMMWGGHRMMGGHQKQPEKQVEAAASPGQTSVEVSSSPVEAIEDDSSHRHH